MDNILRKRAFILILVCLCLFTGCFPEHISYRMVQKRAEEYMKCFVDKDEEKLFSYFADERRTKRKEQTMEEIKEAFDNIIDGDIVSYEYKGDGGGRETVDCGKIKLFSRLPEFYNVKTDKGKTYMIEFSYYHVWKEYPEREGLNRIYIYKDNDFNKLLIVIGGVYDPNSEDW